VFVRGIRTRVTGEPKVCVSITAGPITKLFAWGEGDSGGHVLRETTSRGLCGPVCPARTSERGGEGDCVKERGGGEGERERERALGLPLCHIPRKLPFPVSRYKSQKMPQPNEMCVCVYYTFRPLSGHLHLCTSSILF
jgi:hypothetical protein